MDFRRIIFRKEMLESVAEAFWSQFKSKTPLQVCGLETAALPIVSAIALQQPDSFKGSMAAFFMRKSRKKTVLCV